MSATRYLTLWIVEPTNSKWSEGEVKWIEVRWGGVKWSEVKWSEVKWIEVRWSEVKWSEKKWSEVKWSEKKWSEVKWSEVKWKWSEVKWSEVKWSEVKWKWSEGKWSEVKAVRLFLSSFLPRDTYFVACRSFRNAHQKFKTYNVWDLLTSVKIIKVLVCIEVQWMICFTYWFDVMFQRMIEVLAPYYDLFSGPRIDLKIVL